MDQVTLTILVAVLAALTFGGVGFAVFAPVMERQSRMNRRVQSVVQGQKVAKSRKKQDSADVTAQRRKQVQETLKDLEKQQKEKKKKQTLKQQIEQAGLEITPNMFFILSGVFGVLFGFTIFAAGQPPYVALGAMFAATLGLPKWFLGFLTGRRQKAFLEEFANALDVIVRGVKAGLPIGECLKIIARESAEPVASEFMELVEGQKVGISLDQGLERMYERMPLAEVNFFMIVLTIQQKSGGNLSEALGNLSNVLRSRKLMRSKIQAMSSEAKASAMIIGSLPPGVMTMVYITTPDYINLLFTEQTGNIMLVGGILWMATGVLIMKKMINFNF